MSNKTFTSSKILVVVSAANEFHLEGNKTHATGYFLGELYEPIEILERAGIEIDIATPEGISPSVDKDSERWIYWNFNSSALSRARKFAESDLRMQSPIALESLEVEDLQKYDGIFVPGGHGPMVDLFKSPAMAKILMQFHSEGKPIGLICHAPVVLLSLADQDPWPFSGYTMTVFSNIEEKIAEKLFLGGKVPFYPQSELKKLGANIKTGFIPSTSYVRRDRELITGQNPSSPREFGQVYLEALQDYLQNGRLN